MAHVANYIMTLRQARGFSRARLAEATGTTEMSILRIEKQGQEPSGPLLVRLVSALGGSWDIVERLIASTEEDPLEQVLAEARETGAQLIDPARFDQFLELVASGVPPEDAARRVLQRP